MTHVTCRLTVKNRDQLQKPTLGNRVWATFLHFLHFDEHQSTWHRNTSEASEWLSLLNDGPACSSCCSASASTDVMSGSRYRSSHFRASPLNKSSLVITFTWAICHTDTDRHIYTDIDREIYKQTQTQRQTWTDTERDINGAAI